MAAAHGFKPVFGHTEPKRGAEWWGKSVLLTFGLFKSEPLSERNPRWPLPQEWICTRYHGVECKAVFAGKPAPTIDRGVSGRLASAVRPSSQRCGDPTSQLPHLDFGASDGHASAVRPSREQAPSPQI
ncbi:hypothetical protein E4O98_13140 [Pseudomonas sp. W2Jun17]|nr:hypothetical protein [Pseudomonas sp. W2Jun17]